MKRLGLSVVLVFFLAAGLGVVHAKAASCSGTVFKHAYKVQVCVPKGWSEEVKNTIVKIKVQKVWNVSLRLEPMTVVPGYLHSVRHSLAPAVGARKDSVRVVPSTGREEVAESKPSGSERG